MPIGDSKEIALALARGGYREAARIKGRVITRMDTNWDIAPDLETLTKMSAAIVVGEASEGLARLSSGGKLITTLYDVTVTRIIKGNFRKGNTIQVSMVGGKVEFPDGTSAEIHTPGFEKMSKGKTYLLFLKENPQEGTVLILSGGSRGLFEIAGNKTLAMGRVTETVRNQLSEKDSNRLLSDIEEYSSKWPDP